MLLQAMCVSSMIVNIKPKLTFDTKLIDKISNLEWLYNDVLYIHNIEFTTSANNDDDDDDENNITLHISTCAIYLSGLMRFYYG